MSKELQERYGNNTETLSIINDLGTLFQKWKDLPSGFSIGDYDPELTKSILSDIGYSVIHSERIINQQGVPSLFLLITEKEVSQEIWTKLQNQYPSNACRTIIYTLKAIQRKYKSIPPSFYVDNAINLELLHSILLDIGYDIVSTKPCICAKQNNYVLIRISNKFLS